MSDETRLSLRGRTQVLAEMQEILDGYGSSYFEIGRSMVEHWRDLLNRDAAEELTQRIPQLERDLAAIEESKKVRRSTLDLEIDL